MQFFLLDHWYNYIFILSASHILCHTLRVFQLFPLLKVNFAQVLLAGEESEDSEEYEYDEVITRNKASGSSGTRLVGARTAKRLETPFVVAMNTYG